MKAILWQKGLRGMGLPLLLAGLGVLLTGCPFDGVVGHTTVNVFYYPQNPSLCDEFAGVRVDPGGALIPLDPTTDPPTPPEPGGVFTSSDLKQPVAWTGGPTRLESRGPLVFLCQGAQGYRETLGPRWPFPQDREGYHKSIILVEDPSAPGLLRWYYAYLDLESPRTNSGE